MTNTVSGLMQAAMDRIAHPAAEIDRSKRIIDEFKINKWWHSLDSQTIIKLFQESKDWMMFYSMDNPHNCLSYDMIRNVRCYDPKIRDLLGVCLHDLDKFEDLTELIECTMKYDRNGNFKNTYYPNIYSLTRKYMNESTYRNLLQMPQIQEQLQNPQTVQKCREYLKESVLLNIFNEYVPSKCIVM